MKDFLLLLINNILPIFTLIILGVFTNKKQTLDIKTLSKLVFYVLSPCYIFVYFYTTDMPADMINIILIIILTYPFNILTAFIVSKFTAYDNGLRNAFANSVMFYNVVNFGIPLVNIIFSSYQDPSCLELAQAVMLIVLMLQNIFANTIGLLNAMGGSFSLKTAFIKITKMPILYAMVIALLLKVYKVDITSTFTWVSMNYIAQALISISLITLGAQLRTISFISIESSVFLSAFFRLIINPIFTLALILLFKINNVAAQTLLITTSVPTAINSALIAIEFNNNQNFASKTVITSTVLSFFSIGIIVYISRILFPF